MFKLFFYELQKILFNKFFVGILVSLLISNVFLLWYMNRPSENQTPLKAYHMLSDELDEVPDEQQKLAYVTEYYNTVKGIALVENVHLYETWQNDRGNQLAEGLKEQNSDSYNHYYELWKSGEYTSFTQNIRQEEVFAQEIYDEMLAISQYNVFLETIQNDARTLSGISIFSKGVSDGFSSRNIEKTADDYAAMKQVYISYDISYGIVSATSFLITDFLAFSILFVFAFIMIYEEKKKGLFDFIRPTPRGRLDTMMAKNLVLAVYTAIIIILLYGSNLLFFSITTGLGDLSRSIQSIGAFSGSTISLSVGQFLLWYFIVKWLACFLIGLIVLFVSTLFRSLPSAFGVCVCLILGGFALYSFIPVNSNITVFKHINIFALFRVQDMLGKYLNLNVLGQPVSIFALRLVIIILLTVVLLIGTIIVFASTPKKSIFVRQKKLLKWKKPRISPGKSILSAESYKIFSINKSWLIITVYLIFMLYSTVNIIVYLSPNEIIYKSYMKQLEGPITQEKIDFIEQERLRFETAQNQLDAIDSQIINDANTDVYAMETIQDLERELFGFPSFEQVWEQYVYVQEVPHTQFVYEPGYEEMFGISEQYSSTNFIAICIVLVLCCYAVFPMENVAGVHRLLTSTPLGRRHLTKIKLRICMAITLAIIVSSMLFEFISVSKNYGLSGIGAPITSLSAYQYMPSFITIGLFILICIILKVLACFTITLIVLAISKVVRNSIYTILLCILIIVLPVTFYQMGLEWAGHFSFVPLFEAGKMFASGRTIQVVLYLLIAVVISGVCICYTVRKNK